MKPSRRLDQWLWFARFFKSRSLATKVCGSGKVRLNTKRVGKPGQPVRAGDVLMFAQARRVRVIQIEDIGTRRGPAAEAALLYTDLAPPAAKAKAPAPTDGSAAPRREAGAGRPTKAERRALERIRSAARR